MNAAEFFDEARRLNVRLELPAEMAVPVHSLSNEALFQLPLLAMTVLAIAKGKAKPEWPELGQIVGECLERSVAGFKGSSQDIGWSGNLRIRTIKALTFLETSNLVVVDSQTKRVAATELGKRIYQSVMDAESPLSACLHTVELSYQYMRDEARIEGDVR